jgi:hypothetical protein
MSAPSPGPARPTRSPRRASPVGRGTRAWRNLSRERRLAVFASLALFVTLFLPWYQETVIARGTTTLQNLSESLTGWGAFSFVEAAVLLVGVGVIALLFIRAEGHPFRVPFGDGAVITAAGFWTCVLVIWRIFDKQGTSNHGQLATTSGIEWGIFFALAAAAFLAYAGSRIRATTGPEDLHTDPGASRRADSSQRRRRGAVDPDAASGASRGAARGSAGELGAGSGAGADAPATDEIRPRRRRVERPDPGLFENVETEWPERPTEPRLTRRRMTDEERETEPGPPGSSPPAGGGAHPGAGDDTRPTEVTPGREATPGSEARTRQMTPPSTTAARRGRDADDQLTMPLDRQDQ